MISKNTIKLINSLTKKKYRQKEKLFLVEGDKIVLEILNSEYKISQIFATDKFLNQYKDNIKKAQQIYEVGSEEIKKISLLKTPQNCLAICELPSTSIFPDRLTTNLTLYLDGIQDPGNLGTIIRICDWFGIDQIFCSPDTADVFNPKVIQSSMGSFCRVRILYTPFEKLTNQFKETHQVLGAFLQGNNIYSEDLPTHAILVVGNEGKGIRNEIEQHIDKKIMIPSFAKKNNGAESLNAAVATGIICSEFKRQNLLSTIQSERTK